MYFILLSSNILFEFSYHGYKFKKYDRHTIKVCISYPRFYCEYTYVDNINYTQIKNLQYNRNSVKYMLTVDAVSNNVKKLDNGTIEFLLHVSYAEAHHTSYGFPMTC